MGGHQAGGEEAQTLKKIQCEGCPHREGSKPALMASSSSLPDTSTAPQPCDCNSHMMGRLLLALMA